MSLAGRCGHECVCDCQIHNPGNRSAPVHSSACCNYKCPFCFAHIKDGMVENHLNACHGRTVTEAEAASGEWGLFGPNLGNYLAEAVEATKPIAGAETESASLDEETARMRFLKAHFEQ